MARINEINYLNILAEQDGTSLEDINYYHLKKPFCDHERARYLMDIAQILQLMPPPPARILDAGVGSGWTSRMFGLSGYNVVGIDISSDMISLARTMCEGVANVEFHAIDYERNLDLGDFDCAVIYEALHHADDPGAAVTSIYRSLKKGGTLITIEPGRGHADASAEIMKKYGTTEKDMEFSFQRLLMAQAGFLSIKKYMRLSALYWLDISTTEGEREQEVQLGGALFNLRERGLSSVVVAMK
jgi:SAM-dependent methyltransferase